MARDFSSVLWGNTDAYKEFVRHVLVHVVGQVKMSKMSMSYESGSLTFEKAVSVGDEAFAMMLLDDRWRLWEKIAVQRRRSADNSPGTHNVGDEDDQRTFSSTNSGSRKKYDGDNLTRFSMFGPHAPGKKGFNVEFANHVHLFYCYKVYNHRSANPDFRKNMRDWYSSDVARGVKKRKREVPKRKKLPFKASWVEGKSGRVESDVEQAHDN